MKKVLKILTQHYEIKFKNLIIFNMMSKNIKLKVTNEISILVIFIFSIFVNRSLTFDVHSLGLSMQAYSEIFPNTENILQPHRVFLP